MPKACNRINVHVKDDFVDGVLVPIWTQGTRAKVYALVFNGMDEVSTFIKQLPPQASGRYTSTIHRLADGLPVTGDRCHNVDPNKTKKKKQAKGLVELKDIGSKTRIMAFRHHHRDPDTGAEEARIILTHAFQKKEDKLDESQIVEADRRRQYYLTKIDEAEAKRAAAGARGRRRP